MRFKKFCVPVQSQYIEGIFFANTKRVLMGPSGCSGQHCCNNDTRHSLTGELMCHFPYAVLALAFGLILLSLVTACVAVRDSACGVNESFYRLFHTFHFLHIVFAGAGATLAFLRYSNRWWRAVVVGTLVPGVFCVLSDVVFPYIGGRLLGVAMRLHICFFHNWSTITIFLGVGVLMGFVLRLHVAQVPQGSLFTYWLHFGHIALSALAALFYLVSHGFYAWDQQMGLVFLMLLVAVVIPCTLSDIVVPIFVAKNGRK